MCVKVMSRYSVGVMWVPRYTVFWSCLSSESVSFQSSEACVAVLTGSYAVTEGTLSSGRVFKWSLLPFSLRKPVLQCLVGVTWLPKAPCLQALFSNGVSSLSVFESMCCSVTGKYVVKRYIAIQDS